jgi:hypothetical protein
MTLDKRKTKTKSGKGELQWPVYSVGQQLRDDDLNAGVAYTRELNKLLFRSLFGCGVVCGLKVDPKFDHCGRLVVTVEPGIALDACGTAIHLPNPVIITLDPECGDRISEKLYVVARSDSSCCGHRETACGCDDHSTSPTRHLLGYEIALVQTIPACACHNMHKDHREQPAEKPEKTDAEIEQQSEDKKKKAQEAGGEAVAVSAELSMDTHNCLCADPKLPGNEGHYAGVCSACGCDTGEWVVLAALASNINDRKVDAHHHVRNYIRPMRMSDPLTRVTPKINQS